MKETKETEALLQDLMNAQSYVWADAPYQDNAVGETLEFRIQMLNGVAYLHTGDACYDTDHRGDWGAGAVGPRDHACCVRDALEDAYDQAEDDAASHELVDRPEQDVKDLQHENDIRKAGLPDGGIPFIDEGQTRWEK